MKSSLILLLVVTVLFLGGCDYIKNLKYKNKVFTVRTEIGNPPDIVTWKDATNLSYDKENVIYYF